MFGATIIPGEGKASALGFPTANLDLHPIDTKLEDGIYAVIAWVDGQRMGGALYICSNPQKVEVHLLKHNGKVLYGSYLEVDVIRKVSNVEPFTDLPSLKKKITDDVQKVQGILAELDDSL